MDNKNTTKAPIDVDVTDDKLTLTVEDEKIEITEDALVKGGAQVLKTAAATVGLGLLGAIGGAIIGAIVAPVGLGVLAGFGGFLLGGFGGFQVGGFMMKQTAAYKTLKKVGEAEAKKPGAFANAIDSLGKKINGLKKDGAKDAFAQAKDKKPAADANNDNTAAPTAPAKKNAPKA